MFNSNFDDVYIFSSFFPPNFQKSCKFDVLYKVFINILKIEHKTLILWVSK